MSRMTDFCDIACDECQQWVPGIDPSTKLQRAVLKGDGWTTRYGPTKRLEDVCPKCNGADPEYWRKVNA